MIKDKILDQLLTDWFTKSIFLRITKDVAMVGVSFEEKAILSDQLLDIIYS